MTDTNKADWSKRYQHLLKQLKSAKDKIELNKTALEITKLMIIETETANMELEQIFDQSSSGIWVIDTNFEILRMNETLAKLAGKKKDQVRGLKCYDVFPIPMCATHDCPMHKIKQGRQNLEFDIEKKTRHGTTASYLLTVNPFYGLTGKTMGLVGEFKDITLRRDAERALRQANKRLERLSHIDGLTQVANRRHFDEFLKTEIKRANRSLSPLSLVFCDIDHFKRFNDTYGHQAGDACLKTVAKVIRSNLHRPEDFVARYGGEEFVLVLPDTDGRGAFHLAEVVREALLRQEIPHETSPIAPYVTLSLGVTCLETGQNGEIKGSDRMCEAIIKIADQALYEAKQQGRNRTVLKMAPAVENGIARQHKAVMNQAYAPRF